MTDALAPGRTVGILGGGQLARMLAVATARLGLHVHVFDPAADAPAFALARSATVAGWDDTAALDAFAASVDVVTYEFENIPPAALERLARHRPVRPNPRALAVSRDRIAEKTFLAGLGLTVAPWAPVSDCIAGAVAAIGAPAILKTATLGYDGKGQVRIAAPGAAAAAWDALGRVPCVLEALVPFTAEISVIAARGLDGAVAAYDPGLNVHEGGILRRTTVPAPIPARLRTDAVLIAGRILGALDYVGVIGVELFVTPAGLVVNEIAPRVHNSGHWTQNGCAVDQFEQHVRAIAGWPLGDGRRHSDVTMENLIGEDIARLPAIAREAGAAIHLYGKAEVRPGRKMGHVNRIRAPG
ncbi:MAG: 5-(carboxyamino)imidazole ribonucleotide synthase [Gemmobacter sp.]